MTLFRGGNVKMMTLLRPYFVKIDTLFRGTFEQFSTLLRTSFEKQNIARKVIFSLSRGIFYNFRGKMMDEAIENRNWREICF